MEIGNCWRSTTVLLANHQKIISMFKKSDAWSKRATFCFVLFCFFGLQLKVRYSPNRIHKVNGKFTNTDRSKVYFWFAWILNGFSMSFCPGWKATHLPWFLAGTVNGEERRDGLLHEAVVAQEVMRIVVMPRVHLFLECRFDKISTSQATNFCLMPGFDI